MILRTCTPIPNAERIARWRRATAPSDDIDRQCRYSRLAWGVRWQAELRARPIPRYRALVVRERAS